MNRIQTAYLGLSALALFATEAALAADLGVTGKVALVSKQDCEGMLEIDAFTGAVLQNQHDRPEWADGLALAQLAERHTFYTSRLGADYADSHQFPDVYAYEDLGWLGVDVADGEEVIHIEADDEHRMEVLATVLGVDRESGDITGVLAEAEIARDNTRTDGELAAFDGAQAEGYEQATASK